MIYAALLYAMLADPEYAIRESATSRLIQLVDRHPSFYGPPLAEWIRAATCPEVRRRAIGIVRVYDRWRVNSYVPAVVPVWPCCDMMPAANPLVPFGMAHDLRDRPSARDWYGIGSPPTAAGGLEAGPWWVHYRAGTERMIRQKLRDGATADECDRLLARMWAIEQAAQGDCPSAWHESANWTRWEGGYPRPRWNSNTSTTGDAIGPNGRAVVVPFSHAAP